MNTTLHNAVRPLLGFVGFSGSGKTTLLTALLPLLVKTGVRVGMIKHAHHDFDIDQPGKDSYLLRKAGASQVLVASSRRWALMTENETNETEPEPNLNALVARLNHLQLDLILVEGFKHELYPKIEVHRPSLGHPLLCVSDSSIIALACDETPQLAVSIPCIRLNQPDAVVQFIRMQILTKKT